MAEEETIFTSLMNFRFEGDDGDVGGHNLGNLILYGYDSKQAVGFYGSYSYIFKILKSKGNIVPCSLQVITLYAIMEDGTIVRGESNISRV